MPAQHPNPANRDEASGTGARATTWLRLGSLLVIAGALLAIARLLPLNELTERLSTFVQDLGVWGPVIFAGIYVVATVLMLPGSALTLLAGAIFGLWTGVITASTGATLGAAAAFLIARYIARPTIERRLASSRRFRAVDHAIEREGWKIVALLRLSPAVPFNIQNYLYGLTAIRFWPCVLTSWVAMLPGAFMYVYLGYAGRASVAAATGASRERTWPEWILLGLGLLATVVVTVFVTRVARRAMRRTELEVEDDEATAQENVMTEPSSRFVTAIYVVLALVAVTGAVAAALYPDEFRAYFAGVTDVAADSREHLV